MQMVAKTTATAKAWGSALSHLLACFEAMKAEPCEHLQLLYK
jgi:hypothetical protein